MKSQRPQRNQSPLVTDFGGACSLDPLPDMIPENEIAQICPQTPQQLPMVLAEVFPFCLPICRQEKQSFPHGSPHFPIGETSYLRTNSTSR